MNYKKIIIINCFFISANFMNASNEKPTSNFSNQLKTPATIQEDLEANAHKKLKALFKDDRQAPLNKAFKQIVITSTHKSSEMKSASTQTGQEESDYEKEYPYDLYK